MDEGAADVDVVGGSEQEPGDGPVHQHTDHRNPDHDSRLDLNRLQQALDGLVEDIERYRQQRQSVEKRCQNTGALISESLGGRARTGVKKHCYPGEQQSQQISDVVAGFGEQCQTVGTYTGYQRDQYVDKGRDQRIAQGPRAHGSVGMRMRSVVVHTLSLTLFSPSIHGPASSWQMRTHCGQSIRRQLTETRAYGDSANASCWIKAT